MSGEIRVHVEGPLPSEKDIANALQVHPLNRRADMTPAQYAALLTVLERIAAALERIADQGNHHLEQEPPHGETPPP
jgi:hypothetical protein